MKRILVCIIMVLALGGTVFLSSVQTEFENTLERLENEGYNVECIVKENDTITGRKITLKVFLDSVLTEELEFVKEKKCGGIRYEYDEAGVLRKSVRYIYAEEQEMKSACRIYDAHGNLLEYEQYFEGQLWKTDHYRYDEKDRLISHSDTMGPGCIQEYSYAEKYIYDNEKILRKEKYVNGNLESMLVYKYDQHGKLIETNEYRRGELVETKRY